MEYKKAQLSSLAGNKFILYLLMLVFLIILIVIMVSMKDNASSLIGGIF